MFNQYNCFHFKIKGCKSKTKGKGMSWYHPVQETLYYNIFVYYLIYISAGLNSGSVTGIVIGVILIIIVVSVIVNLIVICILHKKKGQYII